jgi:flagellar transcriptional activator FlhD
MDRDLYELNLTYLLKARELLLSGQEHKAYVTMGLSRDAAAQLKRLPISRLKELAASNVLCFSMRVPPQYWKDLAEWHEEAPLSESLRVQLLMNGSSGGENGQSGLPT